MTNVARASESARYLSSHAAQLPVLGKHGQDRVRRVCVHISGLGRIGGSIAVDLHQAGIGHVLGNDLQKLQRENSAQWAFLRPHDVGREKAFVLERFFAGRPDFIFEPLVAPTESREVDPYIKRAHLVISCANTVQGRLAAERKAIHYRKPVMQAAAFDGRKHLQGLITLRLPENHWSACFGCCLNEKQEFPRGEGLLATVTSALAAIAANMAVELLSGFRCEFLRRHSMFWIDLETYRIEALAVQRKPGCALCGRTQA